MGPDEEIASLRYSLEQMVAQVESQKRLIQVLEEDLKWLQKLASDGWIHPEDIKRQIESLEAENRQLLREAAASRGYPDPDEAHERELERLHGELRGVTAERDELLALNRSLERQNMALRADKESR